METRLASASRRSALYWLLGDIALTVPSRAFVERLRPVLKRTPTDRHALSVRLAELGDALPKPDDYAHIERLAVDFTYLFGGLKEGYGLTPPLESVQRAPYSAEVPIALAREYADAGFASVEEHGPADHLGVEMKFLSLLCYSEMRAWQNADTPAVATWIRLECDFVQRHLAHWATERWRQSGKCAKEQFYRLAGSIAADALLEEATASSDVLAA